ncbi:MAG: sodium/proline symporter [Planctomycetes bacterium]|nr:sodium/proline symporter [Planctomycetota bacterium]
MPPEINSGIICVAFGIYTLAIVGVGLYSARFARHSDEDYFLAGRSLGSWVAALSASASSESGWVTLGLVGMAFGTGISAYWIIPGCLLGFVFNWFVIAGRMNDRARALGAVTLPDFFAFNFREHTPLLRALSVLVILVSMLLYVAAQFAAAGQAFAATFGGYFESIMASVFSLSYDGVDYHVGVLIGGVIVLLYTVTGGFRAVCWTDFLQALLMVGTLVVFPLYLLATQHGYGFIVEQFEAAEASGAASGLLGFIPPFNTQAQTAALIGFLLGHTALGINFGYPGQPHVLVRFMALRHRKTAIAAGAIAVVWGALVYWGAVTIGLLARALTLSGVEWGHLLTESENAKQLGLVISAMHMLPEVLSGLVLAAVLAAICSTADSQLVVAASAAANDLYARLFEKAGKRSHLVVNRLAVLGLGVLAVLLVFNRDINVYQFVLTYGWAILGASFGPQVILILLWKRASYAGCLAGMFTGFVTAIAWHHLYDEAATGVHVYNLVLAFVLALVVNVVVSLLWPTPAEQRGFPVVDSGRLAGRQES